MPARGKRRALGQHFLRDQGIALQIAETAVQLASEHGCKALLEIGPGKGAITEPILRLLTDAPVVEDVILAERDDFLSAEWKIRAPEFPHPLRVEAGDFLDLPEGKWLCKTPLAVASNLPYSAGTAIVVRLAKHWKDIPFMVLMFQAEVAQRLRAEPNTKSWGSLSVLIQNNWDVTKLRSVPPGAFSPPPEVDSEVIVLKSRKAPRVQTGQSPQELKRWDSLLRAAFAHRRKMLRSGLSPGVMREALAQSGLDGTLRAEALSWEDWEKLYRALSELQ